MDHSEDGEDPKPSRAHALRGPLRIVAMILVCLFGLISFQVVVLVFFLFVFAAVLGVLAYHGRRQMRRGDPSVDAAFVAKATRLCAALCVVIVCWIAGYFIHLEYAERKLVPVIFAAIHHRYEHGSFPLYAHELRPALAGFTGVNDYGNGQIYFNYRALCLIRAEYTVHKDGHFTLMFMTFASVRHTYGSKTFGWTDWQ